MKKQAAKEETRKKALINLEETGKTVEEINNRGKTKTAINKIVVAINSRVVINPTVAEEISSNRLEATLRAEVTNQTATKEIIIQTGSKVQAIIATGQTEVVEDRVGSSGQIKTPITAGIKNNKVLL